MAWWAFIGEIDWRIVGPIATWFSGVLGAITLLTVLNREFWKKPKLSFHLDVRTQRETKLPWAGIAERSVWVRIRVENARGRRVAKNGCAFLVGVQEIVADGSAFHLFTDDCRPLSWMHADDYLPTGRDLFPGVANYVDVFFAYDGSPNLYSTAKPKVILNPARYRIAVQVSAEEGNGDVIYLEIDNTAGAWDKLKVVQSHHGRWVEPTTPVDRCFRM